MLKRNIISNKVYPNVYWIFDSNKDKITQDLYDVTSKMNNNEYFKIVVSKLHDNLLSIIGNFPICWEKRYLCGI